ncbi:MAG: baseplate J/gp47 family protein [Oxalobacter sp.]|nr:baseplate J/gp47 family protein [Oxalobacter sp.]
MAETIPRWNLPDVDFIETDSSTIEAAIINRYETLAGRSLAKGDPVRLFLETIAAVIIQQRTAINLAARQNLLSYAQGEYLDALGVYLNVERLPAASAVTTLEFTLSSALAQTYTIPSGFEVTNGIVTFATDRELIIPAGSMTGTVDATCTTAGTAGNAYLAGQVNTIVSPMTFLASAENTTATAGGADIETDEAFAERIRLAPNAFSVAGPKKAYEFHTYSVSSAIIDVSVTTPQPGYVNVYPLMTGGSLPPQELLDDIAEHLNIETIRPLTDYVQVLAPTAVSYAITIDWWISQKDRERIDAIKTAVASAVQEYRLWQQGRIGRDISPEKLLAMVVNAGAARVNSATLAPNAFVEVPEGSVAQCTAVTVTYQGLKDE